MNRSDPSDDDSSSDETGQPAKRLRADTLGASSNTSLGSIAQDSDDEPSDNVQYTVDSQQRNALSYKERNSQERLSRSSLSENCSSPNDQYEDESETPRAHFQDSTENRFSDKNVDNQSNLTTSMKRDYSGKARQVMPKMGYTPGKDLAKFEPAKRLRADTLGASSTTSHGSIAQDSDDDPSDNGQYNIDLHQRNALSYKERDPQEEIRLSRSSLSENCSSPNDQYEDESETPRAHFQDSTEKRFFKKNVDHDDNSQLSLSIKGGYSDKAKRMMSTMGYKPGKGLGKFEHGRVEPVEASNQKGRRGLGLKSSILGEVPNDFQWKPDDRKPEAREEVSWIPSATLEPLSGDQLDEWLQKGPKKLTIDDETNFVGPQILDGILKSKNIFDNLKDEDLRRARFRSNPFETIGSVIFLNRAAVKMANLDAVFDFMFTKPTKENGESAVDNTKEILYFADVCAGPGGFSEYVLFRRGWKAKGFGFTLKGQNDFKLSDFYAGTSETFNPYYGIKDDGNVFDPANLNSLKDKVLKHTDDKGVHFLMADGGFSVEGNENIQEILSKQLYLCQCLAGLMLVRTGGHFVVKLFDVFTNFSVGLLYIMYRCFEKVCIHKPVTSRPANSERYLVCKWKRLGTESAENHLFSVNSILWQQREQGLDVTQLVPLSVIQEERDFYEYIFNSNCVIGVNQIKNLLKIAAFSKDKSLKETAQAEMREECLKLWQLPDEVRTQPERMNADNTIANILTMVKMKPPEANDLLSFKNNVLTKQSHMLQTVDDLKVFKSVYDWHFMFLNSEKNNPQLTFFLGCGGKQVYKLDGTYWTLVVDLHLTMPAKTLIYGEVVKELHGEGSQQMFSKALHVVDALILGGRDISYLPLTGRLNQCSLFCIALERPFDPQAIPLRCKRLFNMENFSNAMSKLEYRVTKQIRKAVTIKIPNRSSSSEMFHVVHSILFMKEIKEPWVSRISRSSGHKYYFRIGKDNKPQSEYIILPEACMDTLNSYMSRVLWPWESPVNILENLTKQGLSRAQMEDYIQNNRNR